MSRRPLADQVVVVTGASSGIGLATARLFAARGATVVLAARSKGTLDDVAAAIEADGGRALAVPTDVSDPAQVRDLAERAVAAFGRIDTWVNNAGVSAYGTVEELEVGDLRRVVEVNLLGTMYGVKAVLPHFRAQGGGTVVNVASGLGKRAVPLQAPYCATKHGVVGFDEALRMELMASDIDVAVVDVLPASINTPFFRHARSRMGVQARPLPPTYDPSVVAEAIVGAAERPVREVYVGGAAKMFAVMQRLSPAATDRLMLLPALRGQRSRRPVGPDNLDEASPVPGDERGEWRALRHSIYTRVFALHPWRGAAVAAVALGAGVAALRRR